MDWLGVGGGVILVLERSIYPNLYLRVSGKFYCGTQKSRFMQVGFYNLVLLIITEAFSQFINIWLWAFYCPNIKQFQKETF